MCSIFLQMCFEFFLQMCLFFASVFCFLQLCSGFLQVCSEVSDRRKKAFVGDVPPSLTTILYSHGQAVAVTLKWGKCFPEIFDKNKFKILTSGVIILHNCHACSGRLCKL